MPFIKLETVDKKIFEVDVEIVRCSTFIKELLDVCDNTDNKPLALQKVHSETLEKILEWATHHKDDEQSSAGSSSHEKRTDDISPWDAELMNISHNQLFKIMMAANFLNINGLFQLTCKTLANVIKGKTAEQIRETFQIENDFSAEEREQIRKEEEWCGSN